jgi:hypothetical protein
MPKISLQVGSLVSVFILAMSLLTHFAETQQSHQLKHASAAYRDGWQLGNKAARYGNKPHVLVGRWATETDRGLFAAGYFHGYIKDGMAVAPVTWKPDAADQKGFEDGKLAGAEDRQRARPFSVQSRTEYRKALNENGTTNRADESQTRYLQGFALGYQHTYYGVEAAVDRPAGDGRSSAT